MTVSRFSGRREFFGSLLFDRDQHDYMPCNDDETSFLLEGAFRAPVNRLQQRRFADFESLCRDIRIVNEKGEYQHQWLENTIQEGHLSAPLKVSVNITSNCNLRCRHCYSYIESGAKNEMTLSMAENLMDQMAEMGVFLLSVKGGEPFYHSGLMDILDYGRSRGIIVTIISNGLLITCETAERLNDTSVAYLTLSIDGADEETHDFIRGRGAFVKLMEVCRILKKSFRRSLFLYFTMNRRNVHQIPRIFELAGEMKIDGLRFRPLLPLGRAEGRDELNLTGEEYCRAVDTVLHLKPSTSMTVDLPLSDLHVESKELAVNRELYSFGCIAGNTFVHMDPLGNLYPCQYLESPDYLAGNIFSSSFREVWNTSPILHKFRSLAGTPACTSCERFSYCRGGCRARALVNNGDINQPDPWCPLRRCSI
ncbi:MAG: radical SAM protein [Vulcanimicrobiota bacterium]